MSEKQNFQLNPYFVTGFTDGEGCFHVSITEDKKLKVGWRVRLIFEIKLHSRDADLIKQIKVYFNVRGSIRENKELKSIIIQVSSPEDLAQIKNHFQE